MKLFTIFALLQFTHGYSETLLNKLYVGGEPSCHGMSCSTPSAWGSFDMLSDIIGKKYNRLTAIRFSHKNGSVQYYLFRCDCGVEKPIIPYAVINGTTKSCGCYTKEGTKSITHGNSRSGKRHKLYGVWNGMKQRCYNPKLEGYSAYGGRGITVCDEWRDDFVAFKDFALSNGWKPGLTIDRYPNNDGNYEPGNVRFVPIRENIDNRGSNKLDWQKADEIRELFKTGCSYQELAEKYNVTTTHIGAIIGNKTWIKP